jgi:hypothetical protein
MPSLNLHDHEQAETSVLLRLFSTYCPDASLYIPGISMAFEACEYEAWLKLYRVNRAAEVPSTWVYVGN